MKKILLIAIVALLSSCKKSIFIAEQWPRANYKVIGDITATGGIRVYKMKVDSIEYIIVSRYGGGTAIIKHVK